MKTYKIEINPTKEQIIKINKTIGVCRFVYNLFIRVNKERYENNLSFMSGYDFSKYLNNEYRIEHPEHFWITEVSSKATKQSIMNCDKAFRKFFKKESGYPKFKKRNSRVGCYLPKNNENDFKIERHRIKIPTFGFVKLKEYGYLKPNLNIKSCVIKSEGGRYYASFLTDEKPVIIKSLSKTEGVGIDLGLKEFAVISDGSVHDNINKTVKIKKLEKKLRRQQREFSRKLLKKKGESNKNKNRLKIQKLHIRLKNIRTEYVKFVVNSLVKLNPQFTVIEDLNVSGMIKNRHLSKAISKQMFYYFRTYLRNQCEKRDIEFRVVNRWFPSSKICSGCGKIKKDLKLSDRVFKCECGLVMDRDLNASINLKNCEDYIIPNTVG